MLGNGRYIREATTKSRWVVLYVRERVTKVRAGKSVLATRYKRFYCVSVDESRKRWLRDLRTWFRKDKAFIHLLFDGRGARSSWRLKARPLLPQPFTNLHSCVQFPQMQA